MYRKIETRIWADKRFLGWPPQTKLVFMYLLTGRHSHLIPGVIVGYREEVVAAMMRANISIDGKCDGIDDGIGHAISEGVLMACGRAPIMYLRRALKYNKPTSPNQVKSWAAAYNDLPESPLKTKIYQDIVGILDDMSDGMRDAFRDGMPYTEAETETEDILCRAGPTSAHSPIKSNASKHALADAVCSQAVQYLNTVIESSYRGDAPSSRKLIRAIVVKKHTLDDIKRVIDAKAQEWRGGDMEKFLRPRTLFGNKFSDYVDELQNLPKAHVEPPMIAPPPLKRPKKATPKQLKELREAREKLDAEYLKEHGKPIR
jgi:uncharacterized phage protein (TIGR02220 family)